MDGSRPAPRLVLLLVILAGTSATAQSSVPLWPAPSRDAQALRRDNPVVSAVAVHPQAPWVAAAGDDHRIRLEDVDRGRRVHMLEQHTDWVRCLSFTPSGEVLVSAGNDGKIIFWDVANGTPRLFAEHPHAIHGLDISRDGRFLVAVGFTKQLWLYDLASGRLIARKTCPCGDMRAVAFHPDGKSFAVGGRNGVIRRFWLDGRPPQDRPAHKRRIRGLEHSADGQKLISVAEDRRVHIWDLTHPENSQSIPVAGTKILAMALYGEDRLAIGGSDNLIRYWDLAGRVQIGSISVHTGSVAALAVGHDFLVSGSYDTSVRITSVREIESGAKAGATTLSRREN